MEQFFDWPGFLCGFNRGLLVGCIGAFMVGFVTRLVIVWRRGRA